MYADIAMILRKYKKEDGSIKHTFFHSSYAERAMTLEKHKKYKNKYGTSELFWGLGIEEETYFQFTKPIAVAAAIARTAHKAERYSVDYYRTYKPGYLDTLSCHFTDVSGFFQLPLFFNAHSFTKMDLSGNHETTYEKIPQKNKNFHTPSFFQRLQIWKPAYFKEEYENSFTFDGDTIEFMTQNFYRTNVKATIQELLHYKKNFLENVNEYLIEKGVFREKGLLEYPRANPGWVVFHSNPSNILMFNNGTYHINITLPSLLDANAELLEPGLFRRQHQSAIRVYQWLEPLLIAEFGTSDPLHTYNPIYANASQRCAVSRYIGVGTFDSETMPEGKILQLYTKDIAASSQPFWWYTRYHKTSGYVALDKIGVDINYKKHYNHGIELRFFDWFPEDRLDELLRLLVYAANHALEKGDIFNCAYSESWNDTVVGVFQEGRHHRMSNAALASYEKLFQCELIDTTLTVREVYQKICSHLQKKYENSWLASHFLTCDSDGESSSSSSFSCHRLTHSIYN